AGQRGQAHRRPARGDPEQGNRQAAAVRPGLPVSGHRPERSHGRREGGVEPVLPLLVLREPARRVAGELDQPGGLERRTDQDVRFAYYDGVPEDERMPNPQNFLTQALIFVKAPADLHGTAALTWRYRDADRRDSTWAYVPALRRVRAVSPTNRSDGFLGSDMSQDDGPFFDGKPEDFEWNLKGEVEGFRFAEELNLKDVGKARWVPEIGAWDADW